MNRPVILCYTCEGAGRCQDCVSHILLTISLFSSLGDSSPVKECAMEDVGGERVALSTLSPRSELFSAGWRVTGQRMSGKRKNNISRYIYIIYISALQNTHAVWIVTGDIDLGDCGGLMLFTGQCSDRNVLQSTWFWSYVRYLNSCSLQLDYAIMVHFRRFWSVLVNFCLSWSFEVKNKNWRE